MLGINRLAHSFGQIEPPHICKVAWQGQGAYEPLFCRSLAPRLMQRHSAICIPSPHNLILILPHSTLPNPHFTQALKAKQTATDSGTYLYLAVLDDGCADAALLLRPQPWLGSRADPGSNRGPNLAKYRAPATDRVRNCRSCKRGMQWEAMGRVQDAGWVAGVTCKIATMALKILVEAPGFRCSSSCSQKCRIGWHCSHPGRLMDDADQLGASHGSCKRAIEGSATTIIN